MADIMDGMSMNLEQANRQAESSIPGMLCRG